MVNNIILEITVGDLRIGDKIVEYKKFSYPNFVVGGLNKVRILSDGSYSIQVNANLPNSSVSICIIADPTMPIWVNRA